MKLTYVNSGGVSYEEETLTFRLSIFIHQNFSQKGKFWHFHPSKYFHKRNYWCGVGASYAGGTLPIHWCGNQHHRQDCNFVPSVIASIAGSTLLTHQCRSQVPWWDCNFWPDAGASTPGNTLLIHQCKSQVHWYNCNFYSTKYTNVRTGSTPGEIHQRVTQVHWESPPYTSVTPSTPGTPVPPYISVLTTDTGIFVTSTPGAYIRCTPM